MTTEFVVTGCGHSGTGWTARALTRAGIACGHEDRYRLAGGPSSGLVSGLALGLCGDAAWPAAPFLDSLPTSTPVVHLVRDPISVVASIYGVGWLDEGATAARLYVEEHLPSILDAPPGIERACRYWVEWNLLVETSVASPGLYRVEQLSSDPTAFRAFAAALTGRTIDVDRAEHAIRGVPTDHGHKTRLPSRAVMALDSGGEWAGHLLTMRARYGYGRR